MTLRAWALEDSSAEIGSDPVPTEQEGALPAAPETALDRITQVGVALIEYEQLTLLPKVVDTLLQLYRAAGEQQVGLGAQDPKNVRRIERWRAITLRVYTLGAYAAYTDHFDILPLLVVQRPDRSRGERAGLWLRHTVTALARGGRFQGQSLIPPAAEYIADHAVLVRRFGNNKDDVTNALCQFDFMQCVVSVHVQGNIKECYPNFGAFFNRRTERVVESLVTGGVAKEAVPQIDDVRLASIIRELDTLADREFFNFSGWSKNEWTSAKVRAFLDAHSGTEGALG